MISTMSTYVMLMIGVLLVGLGLLGALYLVLSRRAGSRR